MHNASGFSTLIRAWHRPWRKIFLSQRTFVKLPAQLELISLCEHHKRENTTLHEYVNRFLFIIFRLGASNRHANFIFHVLPWHINISRYEDMFTGYSIFRQHINIFEYVNVSRLSATHFPFSGHHSKMRFAPNFTPCRYSTSSIKRNPRPSSRKDKCKSLAI